MSYSRPFFKIFLHVFFYNLVIESFHRTGISYLNVVVVILITGTITTTIFSIIVIVITISFQKKLTILLPLANDSLKTECFILVGGEKMFMKVFGF